MDRFVLKEAVEVPKMGLRALKYQHRASSLTHLHVERAGDANRVFSLAFRTDAPDHTGVPHILEHTTLCGSTKFPVRDPFFKMLSRSLANFMNALTGFDYTYYPFATTNKTDFANLQQVYMDSVFAPLLQRQDFQQEGWRLEPTEVAKPVGPENPLIFKGVVFNEMKGQQSIPAYVHYMAWFKSLYPEMQYSAGDPLYIPDLRYEDLVEYHRTHYTPPNCFTFSYGDFPAEEAMLPLLEYLDKADPSRPKTGAFASPSPVPQPIALTETIVEKQKGPLDPMFPAHRQHRVSMTWYVDNTEDASGDVLKQTMVWRVLGLLLTDGHASPFYQALIDSGIGSEFSVNTGFEETSGRLLFTIGLQGIEESKVPAFKEAVLATIKRLSTEGFAAERVAALLHQAELGNREVDANYGMNMLHKLASRVFHPSGDFMRLVDNDALLTEFSAQLAAEPQLFQREIAARLGADRPYFQFEMAPDAGYEAERAAAEQKRLAQRLASMTEEDTARAITQAREHEQATQQPQNLDVLPTLTTSDIATAIRRFPTTSDKTTRSIPVVRRDTGTQGISYVRLLRDLSGMPRELVPYLLLYTDALTSVGTQEHSMAELENLIKLHTGGLSASAAVRGWGAPEIGYGASALDAKLPQMYELLAELVRAPQLGNLGKLKVILDASAANITNALSDSGHKFAASTASAALNPVRAANDQLSGFAFVRLVQQLAALPESELGAALVPKLEQIHALPWHLRAVGVTQTANADVRREHDAQLEQLAAELGATAAPAAPTVSELYSSATQQRLAEQWSPLPPLRTMASVPSFQVSHVGAAVRGATVDGTALPASPDHADHAALQVLANLLTHKHLHTQIREKGGAYGGGARYDAGSGLFSMFSYRDPTPENTRDVMRGAGRWAAQYAFSARDVEEGKIGIFQGIDAPVSPRAEIGGSIGVRTTDAERQQRRQNLLDVTPSDLNRVAEKYLVPHLETETDNAVCVIGPGKTPENWTAVEL